MKVFCIIPAYNEEKHILRVVDDVLKYCDFVVVVDDASVDSTYDLALKKAQQNKKIKVLRHIINRGQGAALQTGNEYALRNSADLAVHFDADGQFLAEEIPDILKPILDKKADIVFGSRFLGKKNKIPFLKRHLIMPLARLVNFLFFGVRLKDPQSGFRALNKKALSLIYIENDRMAHCSEIMHKAMLYKLKIREVPISVIYNDFGQRFNHGFKILKDLILYKIS